MQRHKESTLYRQRHMDSQNWIMDQGAAEDMVKRVMDQPRGVHSQYTIVQDGTVYQPDQIQMFAQEFGLAAIPLTATADGVDVFGTKI